ncbi:hypothetical protein NDU88_004441 [Pleurodeles waltl]|uniref:Uncharacterized protein n=1 Tax=Pleurodeles waltl TaxID=8319 RepID=A0AAV7VJC2_PLEWA|nr:hypothetical protein NDU88_004441 [Pleurodeles waltl]
MLQTRVGDDVIVRVLVMILRPALERSVVGMSGADRSRKTTAPSMETPDSPIDCRSAGERNKGRNVGDHGTGDGEQAPYVTSLGIKDGEGDYT